MDVFSRMSVCLFVCQHDNFWTIKHRVLSALLKESRPSSNFKAMPHLQVPFPKMWSRMVLANDYAISWAICKSAPRPRQITMSAPHHYRSQTQNEVNLQCGNRVWPRAMCIGILLPVGYRRGGCLPLPPLQWLPTWSMGLPGRHGNSRPNAYQNSPKVGNCCVLFNNHNQQYNVSLSHSSLLERECDWVVRQVAIRHLIDVHTKFHWDLVCCFDVMISALLQDYRKMAYPMCVWRVSFSIIIQPSTYPHQIWWPHSEMIDN